MIGKHFPDAIVYAKGSTPSRTRLYKMGIIANMKEVELVLDVFGFVDGKWERFTKNFNYEAYHTWNRLTDLTHAFDLHHISKINILVA